MRRPTTAPASPRRTVSTSGSSGIYAAVSVAQPGCEDDERGGRRDALGVLLGRPRAAAQDVSAEDHLCGEDLRVVRPLVSHLVGGEVEVQAAPPAPAAGSSGRRACPSAAMSAIGPPRRSTTKPVVGAEPERQVDGADDRLQAVGEDRLLGTASRGLLALARAAPRRRRRARSRSARAPGCSRPRRAAGQGHLREGRERRGRGGR